MDESQKPNERTKEVEAGLCFFQEFHHLQTVKLLRESGNHYDANGFQETADMCLDCGWELLSETGLRHRDIARVRHLIHEAEAAKLVGA